MAEKEVIKMVRVISLYGKGCCPMVKLDSDRVEIGEAGNLCTLTGEEWAVLKQKVLDGEV